MAVAVAPVSGTLAGDTEPVRPSGKHNRDRSTVSVKPRRLVRVIVEVAEWIPVATVRTSGLAESKKPGPGTVTMRKVALTVDPLVPVTETEYDIGTVLAVVSIVKVDVE